MATNGCGWTLDYNCPDQTGADGKTGDDGSIGYECCCTEGMWSYTESPVAAPTLPPTLPFPAKCESIVSSDGCAWTNDYNCPDQTGADDKAEDDGSVGYECCCTEGLWNYTATSAPTTAAMPTDSPTEGITPTHVETNDEAIDKTDVEAVLRGMTIEEKVCVPH